MKTHQVRFSSYLFILLLLYDIIAGRYKCGDYDIYNILKIYNRVTNKIEDEGDDDSGTRFEKKNGMSNLKKKD